MRKKKTIAKAKRKTVGKLKKDFWKVFSLYIKLKYSKDGETVSCFTCGRHLTIGTANCQGGHWLTKKGYPYHYFNENNVRVQCYHCNINLSGNTAVFEHELRKEIGNDTVDDMYQMRSLPSIKRLPSDYIEMIEDYKKRIENLKDE